MRHRRTPSLPAKRRGPNGERLCRMCGQPVPKGRREWCGQTCVDARLLQHSAGARSVLRKRDGGVCALCGLDTERLRRIYNRVLSLARNLFDLRWPERDAFAQRWLERRLGRAIGALRSESWWDADHTTPLVEGGTHDATNIRTLCLWCHRDQTARLARRRAAARAAPTPDHPAQEIRPATPGCAPAEHHRPAPP